MSDLVYKPSQFQRHLWSDHTIADPAAARAEADGRKRYEAFPGFAAEMYHYFHADAPERLGEPAPGSDVFQRLDAAMRAVPEVEDLRSQTVGNDSWAGTVTASMIDELIHKVPPPGEQVEDPRNDEETADYLERLLDGSSEEEQEQIEDLLDQVLDQMEEKRGAAQAAAQAMDDTEVRNAVRSAVKRAEQAIQADQDNLEAFGAGLSDHSGKQARMDVAKKLRRLVADNERLRKIAELAGRLKRIASEEQRKKPRQGCGERVGRRLDNDLGRICHRELVYGHPQLRHVFASRYAERSLVCTEKADRKKDHKGPIVMVLDSSASMGSGDADVWAAAVCLAYLQVAKEQGRAFAIVHFGTKVLRVDTFEGRDEMSPGAVVDSIQFFAADSGTNFIKPLNKTIDLIGELGAFRKADIVMVTDGQAAVTGEWLQSWNQARRDREINCYSILVGSSTRREINDKFSDETVVLAEALRDEKEMYHLFGKV